MGSSVKARTFVSAHMALFDRPGYTERQLRRSDGNCPLRRIKFQLLTIIEKELEVWEAEQAQNISNNSWQRESEYQEIKHLDHKMSMYIEMVEGPTEREWDEFVANRTVQSRRLADQARECLRWWRGEFVRFGTPAR